MTVIVVCAAVLFVLGLLYGAAPRIAAVLEQQPGRHRSPQRQTRAAARTLRDGQ